MDITFNCDKCGQSIVVDEAGAGQLVDCPKCGTPIEVPHKAKPLIEAAMPSLPRVPTRASSPVPKILATLVIIALMLGGGFAAHKLRHFTLDGEVFIVTKSAENIKLGLVSVRLVSLGDLTPYLSNKEATAAKEIARLELLVKTPEVEQAQLNAGGNAEYERLKMEADKLSKEEKRLVDELIRRASDPDKEAFEATNKKYLLAAAAATAARLKATTASNQPAVKSREVRDRLRRDRLSAAKHRYYSPAFYFDGLPTPFRSTKTNGDGKFQMQLPRSCSYALAASAFRHVGDTVEEYYWLLKVDTNGESPRNIMLSNDNLYLGGSRLGKL